MKTNRITCAIILIIFCATQFILKDQKNSSKKIISELHGNHVALKNQLENKRKISTAIASRKRDRPLENSLSQLSQEQHQEFRIHSLVEVLSEPPGSRDLYKLFMSVIPLSKMDQIQLEEVLTNMHPMSLDPIVRETAASIIIEMMVDKISKQKILEIAMENGVHVGDYTRHFETWAKEDPHAAITWLEKKLADGGVQQVGVDINPSSYFYSALLNGVAQDDPEGAISYFLDEMDQGTQEHAVNSLAEILTRMEDKRYALSALDGIKDEEMKKSFILSMAENLGRRQSPPEVVAWFQEHVGATEAEMVLELMLPPKEIAQVQGK